MKKLMNILKIFLLLTCCSSCMWILMEKYHHWTRVLKNNLDCTVRIIGYSSRIYSADTLNLPKFIFHSDTLMIEPNGNLEQKEGGLGSYCEPLDFNKFFRSNTPFYYSDTIPYYCGDLDSIKIIFSNNRFIVVPYNKLYDFWVFEGRSDVSCTEKKGESWSTLIYFITDEMYEQAVPML